MQLPAMLPCQPYLLPVLLLLRGLLRLCLCGVPAIAGSAVLRLLPIVQRGRLGGTRSGSAATDRGHSQSRSASQHVSIVAGKRICKTALLPHVCDITCSGSGRPEKMLSDSVRTTSGGDGSGGSTDSCGAASSANAIPVHGMHDMHDRGCDTEACLLPNIAVQ